MTLGLKILFTGVFVLCLSTLASSNECTRYGHKSTVKPAPRAVTADTESSTLVINKLLYI